MPRQVLIVSALACLLVTGSARADEPAAARKRVDDAIAQSKQQRPCGEYSNPGSTYPRIVFGDGHKAWILLSPKPEKGELDERRLRAWVPRDGKVLVRNDKGFFTFTLTSPDSLKGEDSWTQGGTWKRAQPPKKACAPLGATPGDRKALEAELCEMEVVTLQRERNLDAALSTARACCDTGALSSCDRAGQLLDLQGSKDARPLYDKACNGGFGRSCFYLGKMEDAAGNEAAAKALYKKGCKLGSTEACVEDL